MSVYAAIDLKSFYASVECVERGLDPLDTNLVVADVSRSDKTICLAVSPPLKAYGIPGRARLFEVIRKLESVNYDRRRQAPGRRFYGSSHFASELAAHPELSVGYIAATPRMSHYIDFSTRIYGIYLRHVAPEDIHVYSIDEVFIDLTSYLENSGKTAHEMTMDMIHEVLAETGITATAGIGSNMYLAKVAMDIVAKHMPADSDGVRIAELDEMSYRSLLWNHEPITDFWRVGHGTAERLASYGVKTMGQVARLSLVNEEALYKLFGINAELLIDHAWGWEPCTMPLIKSFRPESNSIGSGQVLMEGYDLKRARVVVKEMADSLALELVDKKLVTDQVVLTAGFEAGNPGEPPPKHAHGSSNLGRLTSSSRLISKAAMEIFDRIMNPALKVRRLGITATHVVPRDVAGFHSEAVQLDLFEDSAELERRQKEMEESLKKERALQETVLNLKKRFGKNTVLRGFNFEEGATGRDRNMQIGGHKA